MNQTTGIVDYAIINMACIQLVGQELNNICVTNPNLLWPWNLIYDRHPHMLNICPCYLKSVIHVHSLSPERTCFLLNIFSQSMLFNKTNIEITHVNIHIVFAKHWGGSLQTIWERYTSWKKLSQLYPNYFNEHLKFHRLPQFI